MRIAAAHAILRDLKTKWISHGATISAAVKRRMQTWEKSKLKLFIAFHRQMWAIHFFPPFCLRFARSIGRWIFFYKFPLFRNHCHSLSAVDAGDVTSSSMKGFSIKPLARRSIKGGSASHRWGEKGNEVRDPFLIGCLISERRKTIPFNLNWCSSGVLLLSLCRFPRQIFFSHKNVKRSCDQLSQVCPMRCAIHF